MNLNKLASIIEKIVKQLPQEKKRVNFIYDLLRAYNLPKASITRLKKGDYNQSKKSGEILWKKKLFFKTEQQQALYLSVDHAQKDPVILKHQPRFIIITDFKTLLAVDTKTHDSLETPLTELSLHYAFFLPWAGMEKTQIQSLNLADVKAAEKLAQLYDIIIQENKIETDKERRGLNIFLSRLLFCFFAEDTGIFKDKQFTNAIASHTQLDGSDLQDYLMDLFKVMNVKQRRTEPAHIKAFPYVYGGLFAGDYPAPKLNAKARKMMVDAGRLNWQQINPDIFGSMIQAVVHSHQRASLGMHYTSVTNIMKVIEPLFLNDLKEQFEKTDGNENKLSKLLDRLYHLRLFDPACGSGNFLIIAYKELCKIEIEIFKQLQPIDNKWNTATSGIQLTQFYGIELDDFAHETAKLSLWLAEHQMNLEFKQVFGSAKPTLPLQKGGHIVCGNATRLDWEDVCPRDDRIEVYIMGNPPYLGARMQSESQKKDVKLVFHKYGKAKKIDYISCWFLKASEYIKKENASFAFVSTNSICQGEQVHLIWPHILSHLVEVFFAHTSFKWTNNAKGNAGVTCIVIGITSIRSQTKYIYTDLLKKQVNNINPYLKNSRNFYVTRRTRTIANFPKMHYGNMAIDGGNLLLTTQEKNQLVDIFPETIKIIKQVQGAQEFLKGKERWCLWIDDENLLIANSVPAIKKRIKEVKDFRLSSSDAGTNRLASNPHQFREMKASKKVSFIVPTVSSERREYIPIGIVESNDVIIAPNQAVYDPELYLFAIISSRIHMTWVRAVAGRLKTDYRYSSTLCYNTFPFPDITKAQKTTFENHVFNVLDEREKHPEKTMAELYDPDKMPEGLRQAHHEMDVAVEQCYRKQPFKSDEERLEYLFKQYEIMIEAEAEVK